MGKKNLLNQQSFEEYYKTIPKEKSDTISYNLRDAYNTYPDSIMQNHENVSNAYKTFKGGLKEYFDKYKKDSRLILP